MWLDVTAALVTYLTPQLGGVSVAATVPSPRPTPLVQLRRIGGVTLPPARETARIDVWCWHASAAQATTLAATVRTAIHALAGRTSLGVPCYRVEELMGPRADDDPLTGASRVWATYTLTLRADEATHPTMI